MLPCHWYTPELSQTNLLYGVSYFNADLLLNIIFNDFLVVVYFLTFVYGLHIYLFSPDFDDILIPNPPYFKPGQSCHSQI